MPWGRVAVLDFNDFFYFLQVVVRGGFTIAGCPKIAAGKDVDACGVYYPDRIGRIEFGSPGRSPKVRAGAIKAYAVTSKSRLAARQKFSR
jgi:hypothetical protein